MKSRINQLILVSMVLATVVVGTSCKSDKPHIQAPGDIRAQVKATIDAKGGCLQAGGMDISAGGKPLDVEYRAGEGRSRWGWWFTYQGKRVGGLAIYGPRIKFILATDPDKTPGTWRQEVLGHEGCHYWAYSSGDMRQGHPNEPRYRKCCEWWLGVDQIAMKLKADRRLEHVSMPRILSVGNAHEARPVDEVFEFRTVCHEQYADPDTGEVRNVRVSMYLIAPTVNMRIELLDFDELQRIAELAAVQWTESSYIHRLGPPSPPGPLKRGFGS